MEKKTIQLNRLELAVVTTEDKTYLKIRHVIHCKETIPNTTFSHLSIIQMICQH